MDIQSHWAVSLQKTKQSQLYHQKKPLAEQLREVNEIIVYYKVRLCEATDLKEKKEIRCCFDALIKNRTKQTAILLALNIAQKENTNDDEQRSIIKKFYHDCLLLQKTVQQYLTV